MAQQFINGIQFTDHDDYTTASAQTDDLDIHSTCVIITPTNDNDAVTGFISENGVTGEEVAIWNNHATNRLRILNNTGSQAGFRVRFPSGTTLTLAPYQSARFTYVDDAGRVGWWLKVEGTIT